MLRSNDPPKLLIDGQATTNQWQLISSNQAKKFCTLATIPPGKVILPYRLWKEFRQELEPRQNEIGVWLKSDEGAVLVADYSSTLPLIAIHFPVLADGRGFSCARQLRERYAFTGELRAVGGFIRDQLTFLRICGINAFAFEGDESLEEISRSLHDFSDSYQVYTDWNLPIFRLRALT